MSEYDSSPQEPEPTKVEAGSKDSLDDTEKPQNTFQPPDGGTRAWLTVAGAFLCQFCSFGFVNAMGLFQSYYEIVLLPDYSSSSLTWISTLQLFLMFFVGPIVGIMVDAFGPRRIIIPASVALVLGVAMLALCKTYWQIFLAQSVVFGLGAASLFMPGIICTNQWFSAKRGLAVGLVASGSSAGGIVWPVFVSKLMDRVGFRDALLWSALMIGVLQLFAIFLVSSPVPPQGRSNKTSAGLQAFKNMSFVAFTCGGFFICWGMFSAFAYVPLFAVETAGFSESLSIYLICILNAGSVLGRTLPSFVSDRLGPMNMMIFMAFLPAVFVLAVWLPISFHPSHVGTVFFAVLYGFASGGFVSLMGPSLISLDPKAPLETLGTRLGGYMTVLSLACLTGLPIQGAIVDREGGYRGMIIFSGVSMFFGGCAMSVARYLQRKQS